MNSTAQQRIVVLSRDTYYHAVDTLRATLPAPLTDDPEDMIRRDHAALAQVASMLPANAEEAILAARYVAAGEHAMGLMRVGSGDGPHVLKCLAQSASMMRQANATRSLLSRVQAERRKRETDAALTVGSAATENSALDQMLGRVRTRARTGRSGVAAVSDGVAVPVQPSPPHDRGASTAFAAVEETGASRAPVSLSEITSRSEGNETRVTQDSPVAVPGNGLYAEPTDSSHETVSPNAGNGTTMRPVIPQPAEADPPDETPVASGPAIPLDARATEDAHPPRRLESPAAAPVHQAWPPAAPVTTATDAPPA